MKKDSNLDRNKRTAPSPDERLPQVFTRDFLDVVKIKETVNTCLYGCNDEAGLQNLIVYDAPFIARHIDGLDYSFAGVSHFLNYGSLKSKRGYVFESLKNTIKLADAVEGTHIPWPNSAECTNITWANSTGASSLQVENEDFHCVFEIPPQTLIRSTVSIDTDLEFLPSAEVVETVRIMRWRRNFLAMVGLKIAYLRRFLKLLDRVIQLIALRLVNPTFRHSRLLLEKAWHLHHGSHPPKLDNRIPNGLCSELLEGLLLNQTPQAR